MTEKKIAKKKIADKKKAVPRKAVKPLPAKKPFPPERGKLKTQKKVPVLPPKEKKEKYYEAIGRRKSASARVRLYTRGDKAFLVNNNLVEKYFGDLELQKIACASLDKMKSRDRFRILVYVRGGGLRGQAEAIRHGTARVLVKFNADYQKRLRRAGYLTRDARVKERKKFGLKKARRAPQWAKR